MISTLHLWISKNHKQSENINKQVKNRLRVHLQENELPYSPKFDKAKDPQSVQQNFNSGQNPIDAIN